MKSLDDQVHPATDANDASTTTAAPVARAVPPEAVMPAPNRPARRRTGRYVAISILGALAVMIVHLVINGVQDNASENAAIAKLTPTSTYNARLSAALKTRVAELKPAEQTLAQAKYLATNPDYMTLYWALSDTQSALGLDKIDLLDAVTKHQYETALHDVDKSMAQLQTARSAVIADIAATPAPTTGG